ncbi:AraC family transcriptional regulator [Permianibacter aggregans]|uniref:AraC family transcriptional regulator n=2 Tax=Permianibacter aggregans TaxID=1510150 RepID=A0A4R6UKQ3_9GAMM|nr:AraC family transcriptional regulator [Permianibacter aggregans]TDQ45913.1 AraC family transcriptional regulator [Permianibacter aggregans]
MPTVMSTLLLLGVIQGGITGVGLLLYAGRKNGTHWLALGVLALSLTLLRLWTHIVGLEAEPLLRRLPLSVDLAIMPLFYLYALSLTAAPTALIRRAFAWLLPWALFMAYSVSVYLASIGQQSVELMDAVAGRWHYALIKQIEDQLTVGLNLLLAALIWLRVSRYHNRIANWVPERFAALLRFLKIIMALALMTAAVNLISFIAHDMLSLDDRSYVSQATNVFYVALVYLAGIIGFRLKDLPQFAPVPAEPSRPELAESEVNASFQQLQALMQSEQLFTEPDLNLNDIAERLGLTALEASKMIKDGSGKNFRGYVNDFRIEAVKQKLNDADYAKVSILAIAMESGFNSESSFYRVFKAATGLSPTAFRERAEHSSD